MSKILQNIIKESFTTSTARPTLLSIHRKTFRYLYDSIAAVQETYQPTATIYGMKYFYSGEDANEVHETGPFGGRYSVEDLSSLDDLVAQQQYEPGDIFKHGLHVFEVIKEWEGITLPGDSTDKELLFDEIIASNIRLVADAAETDKFTPVTSDIQKVRFTLSSWRSKVKSRKIMTRITEEILQDLESNHIDSDNLIQELFASVIAEEINRDLISKLITVAERDEEVNVEGMSYYNAARQLMAEIQRSAQDVYSKSTFTCTYVVCSTRVAGYLQSLDGVKAEVVDGVTKYIIESSGMEIIIDRYALGDYFVVGAKHTLAELDVVAPIYYAPYNPEGTAGMNTVQFGTLDPKALQPAAVVTSRYAISASPFTNDNGTATVVDGEDWVTLAGKCELARLRKVVI